MLLVSFVFLILLQIPLEQLHDYTSLYHVSRMLEFEWTAFDSATQRFKIASAHRQEVGAIYFYRIYVLPRLSRLTGAANTQWCDWPRSRRRS